MADAWLCKAASSSKTIPTILQPNLFLGTVQLNLSVPIYQGGAEYSAIRLDKETVGQQRLNVDQLRDQTRANVVQAWGQLEAAKAEIEAAIRQNDAAERALTAVRNEAQAGQRTTLDVLNAEQALVNARVASSSRNTIGWSHPMLCFPPSDGFQRRSCTSR
jgi:outer membrane protein